MAHTTKGLKALKRWRDSITHEVPTGPHTDVKRRKINPSFQKKIKKIKKLAGPVNQGMRKFSKPEKKKDYVTDPDATFGGRRIKKQGPEIKVSNTQADLSKHIRPKGLGHKAGGRIGLREGTKPLETAMHKKRAEQTQNVKRLTTSDDAYSPERRVLQVEKKTPYGTTGTRKVITDWHNIKEEGKKLKEKFVKKYGSGNLSLYDPPKTRPRKGKKVGKGRTVSIKPPREEKLPGDPIQRKSGGRAGFQHGGRTNLYEELGRVEAEPSNRNRRAEISRVHGELNKGYKSGGRTGLKHGGSAGAVMSGKKVGAQIK